MNTRHETRRYDRAQVAEFRIVREQFGELSNFGGHPIDVNGAYFPTSEALYQACRYPDHPEVQRLIAQQPAPMAAKRTAHSHISKTRRDWREVNVQIMRWVLKAKLACNWESFGELLESTGEMPIVEYSKRDDFWGARLVGEEFVGVNALGRLLMGLRDEYRGPNREALRQVAPPGVPNFLIYGRPVEPIVGPGRIEEVA